MFHLKNNLYECVSDNINNLHNIDDKDFKNIPISKRREKENPNVIKTSMVRYI